MKRIWALLLCIFLAVFPLCGCSSESSGYDDSDTESSEDYDDSEESNVIPYSEAINHVGETVYVQGPVVEWSIPANTNGDPLFINLGESYPSSGRFTIVVWGEVRDQYGIGSEFADNLLNKTITVHGTVENYNGVAQIELQSPDDISDGSGEDYEGDESEDYDEDYEEGYDDEYEDDYEDEYYDDGSDEYYDDEDGYYEY